MTIFDLRAYDARLMRWHNPDPYQEFHSPYCAMGNDWVNLVDPSGGTTEPNVSYTESTGKMPKKAENALGITSYTGIGFQNGKITIGVGILYNENLKDKDLRHETEIHERRHRDKLSHYAKKTKFKFRGHSGNVQEIGAKMAEEGKLDQKSILELFEAMQSEIHKVYIPPTEENPYPDSEIDARLHTLGQLYKEGKKLENTSHGKEKHGTFLRMYYEKFPLHKPKPKPMLMPTGPIRIPEYFKYKWSSGKVGQYA